MSTNFTEASATIVMSPDEIMKRWRPGSHDEPWSWKDEQSELWEQDETSELLVDIHLDGIREPVLLGDDGRVWDGHHRICVAYWLSLGQNVPCIIVDSRQDHHTIKVPGESPYCSECTTKDDYAVWPCRLNEKD